MTYRELIALYKQNKLDEQKKKEVESDIEKQEAISEYLFDREDGDVEEELDSYFVGSTGNSDAEKETENINSVAEVFAEGDVHETISANRSSTHGKKHKKNSQEQKFTLEIQKAIRKAFLKMGVTVGAIVLAVMLFVVFALPKVVDNMYYNPGKTVAENTNQMSLDMAVYSELFLPGYNRDTVTVNAHGYGKYDINIAQNVSLNGRMTNVSGKIEKGELYLYNNNILRRPVGNCFAWFQFPMGKGTRLSDVYGEDSDIMSASGSVRQANEALQKLSDSEKYVAYVSLDKMMPYEEFIAYLKKIGADETLGQIWCAVCTENAVLDDNNNSKSDNQSERNADENLGNQNDSVDDASSVNSNQKDNSSNTSDADSDQELYANMFRESNMGFNYSFSSSTALNWDRDKYPDLLLWDESVFSSEDGFQKRTEQLSDEKAMQTHFTSMLRYLADQKAFTSMMEAEMGDAEQLNQAADYVEKNGLIIYGFACVADKETLLELNEQQDIFLIDTNILQ